MKVRVRFYGMVHDEVGQRELGYELPEGSTVKDLLNVILVDYPVLTEMVYDENGDFRDYLEIAVNHVSVIGLDNALNDDDYIQIMPPIGGG